MGAGSDVVAHIWAYDWSTGAPIPVANNTMIIGVGGYNYNLVFRFVVMNQGKAPTELFWWVGYLYKNGEKNLVVPATQIQLDQGQFKRVDSLPQKGLVWKGAVLKFEARLIAD